MRTLSLLEEIERDVDERIAAMEQVNISYDTVLKLLEQRAGVDNKLQLRAQNKAIQAELEANEHRTIGKEIAKGEIFEEDDYLNQILLRAKAAKTTRERKGSTKASAPSTTSSGALKGSLSKNSVKVLSSRVESKDAFEIPEKKLDRREGEGEAECNYLSLWIAQTARLVDEQRPSESSFLQLIVPSNELIAVQSQFLRSQNISQLPPNLLFESIHERFQSFYTAPNKVFFRRCFYRFT